MHRGSEFLAQLRSEIVIGDGALGTLLSERGAGRGSCYERLNESHPALIRDVHAAYLAAGARVLETNTFGANRLRITGHDAGEVARLNGLGVALAREVAGDHAFIAGAVGPLAPPHGPLAAPLTDDDRREIFREQITALADAGADLIILETFPDLRQLLLALGVAKQHTDLPVVCQMAFHERGHTHAGVGVLAMLDAVLAGGADVVGANCGRGVRAVMAAVDKLGHHSDALISAFPNQGLPAYVDGRYIFGADLPFMIDSAERIAEAGANLIGGCCGTTPAYIAGIAERLAGRAPAMRVRVTIEPTVPASPIAEPPPGPPAGSIIERWNEPLDTPGRRPMIVVELDPPKGLNFEPIVRRARQLRDMGVDAITMADNPVATLHMGNLGLAKIVQDEADVPVVLHLTCRDHNLLGLQSRLLESQVLGVHHILALTGDPARVGDMPGATSVYDMQSFGLVDLIARFNRGQSHNGSSLGSATTFSIGVAFNPNGTARHLAHHVERLRKKVRAGAHFAMTQPIYDPTRFPEMMRATADLGIPIFVGIMPVLSERNAEYLHNEVPGIVLTDDVRRRMKGLSGKEGKRVGLEICKELIDAMPEADGFYLIPPQRSTEMAVELVEHINRRVPAGR